jgi:hypothetical protein
MKQYFKYLNEIGSVFIDKIININNIRLINLKGQRTRERNSLLTEILLLGYPNGQQ